MSSCGSTLDAILRSHDVLVATDNPFQRRARLLQALWRVEQGLPAGKRPSGEPLGSSIDKAHARATGANLLTDAARAAARLELDAMHAGSGQKIDEDRLWANLLSSQPLAFNLFAELGVDLPLATRVFRRFWPDRIARVTRIRFERSPGLGDARYTHDRTAFDVFVEHTTPTGGRGFLGLEVKYHEALTDAPARHRPRYDEVTAKMGCFRPEHLLALRKKPLEQIWRDHMLAGSMLLAPGPWETGLYVFLYPEDNVACDSAAHRYRATLSDGSSFDARTLEAILGALAAETSAPWVEAIRSRYLGWEKLAALTALAVRAA